MQPDIAYKFFSDQLMQQETLTVKSGTGGLSYYSVHSAFPVVADGTHRRFVFEAYHFQS